VNSRESGRSSNSIPLNPIIASMVFVVICVFGLWCGIGLTPSISGGSQPSLTHELQSS
jgi:hypothetical protein